MPATLRRIDQAAARARDLWTIIGKELRNARVGVGLSQRAVAAGVGISQTQLSRIERGAYRTVSIETLAKIGAAVGLDLAIRFYPGGTPIRDKAHAALLQRFRKAAGERWAWAAEVPLPITGDRRAWDRMLTGAEMRIAIEAETRPTDMQDLQRRLALKKRDGQVDRLILVLAGTEWCRRIVRLNDIETMFPIPGRVALRALAEGRDPGGDSIVLI